MLAAIIIDDPLRAVARSRAGFRVGTGRRPWACVELLGQSPLDRFTGFLKNDGCEAVSVVAMDSTPDSTQEATQDPVTASLASYNREGIETILVFRCGPYVDLDLAEMLSFHHEHGEGITRIGTPTGLLDAWMVDCPCVPDDTPILPWLRTATAPIYHSAGYVNLLETPRDYRRLVLDTFNSRCRFRPLGVEIKPGVWVGDGAQIERSVRVVAPAFIGPDAQISEECLITRGSNIERNCRVDFGTAVEDSSVLPNSYVGIGLDLSHAIVDGRNLMSLRHNVKLEITDPIVMRKNAARRSDRHAWAELERSEFALHSAE